MGSDKYPEENHYDSFVTSHGGSCNAFTEGEYTVYSFDVLPIHLSTALDIFANCFISPKLNPDGLEREAEAIESEFQLAMMEDDSRLQQLMSHHAKPEHFMSKFSWGNKKSIVMKPNEENVDVRNTIFGFYNQYYVPNNSCFVLASPHSLDVLESMVAECFEPWVNKLAPIKVPLYSNIPDPNPFIPSELKMISKVIPIKKAHKLHIVWPIPPSIANYRKDTSGYVSHLLGHEGSGSLLSLLKAENLANSVSAGVSGSNFDENSFLSLFTVSIKLTVNGFANWVIVVQKLFQYLAMLKLSGPQKWIFDEIRSMGEANYRFNEEEDPWDLTERMVTALLPCYGRLEEHILSADTVIREWDPTAVQDLLSDYLDLTKCKIYLSSPAFNINKNDDTMDVDDCKLGASGETQGFFFCGSLSFEIS